MYSRCCFLMQAERCYGEKPCCSFLEFARVYFRVLIRMFVEKFKDKTQDLFISRSCLGCCTKAPLVTAVDEPSKGLKIQGRTVKKPAISEDFWSTSTCDMENSAFQSQRSISSISTSNPSFDHHGNAGSTSNPAEFVNHGLLLWSQTRQKWIGSKRSRDQAQVREPRLSWNATYDSLLGSSKPFPLPIPLPEMVDFLVDVWEQEGLYD